MTYLEAREYFLSRPETEEDFPFAINVAVFKVHGKMFATLVEAEDGTFTNLKCEPQEALMLRDIFPEVTPGYHMNKKHWNTVQLDGSLPRGEIERMMDNSYTLVVKSLPKKTRQALEIKHGADTVYR